MIGKLIFVSGLAGAGKTTLIDHAVQSIDNLEAIVTYTTRPRRPSEVNSHEYIFVDEAAYVAIQAASNSWDETLYNGNKYATDAEKYRNDLQDGKNVIVAVTPSMDDIHAMEAIYQTKAITIWINTPATVAAVRIRSDASRARRIEDDTVKHQFSLLFEPSGRLTEDILAFNELITTCLASR